MANKKVVFIDERVGDLDALVAQWHEDSDVYILDQAADGLTQMTEILGSRSELQSIHIVSHGSVGSLLLGSTLVNAGALADHQLALQSIGQSLAVGGDMLLYGCDVGAGEIGQSFIDQIAVMMGANVAASNDATGATSNADWDLEVRSGTVDSALLQAAGGKTANLSTIVVNNGADGPVNHADDATWLTLRDAIDLANKSSGPDTITFSGPMSIGLRATYGELVVNDSADDQLTIIGGGGVNIGPPLSDTGNVYGRIMYVDEGNLSISGVNFTGGAANGGGPWYQGGGGGGLGAGGAIFINNAKVQISDSRFSGNSAHGGSGGGTYYPTVSGGGGGGFHATGNNFVFDGGDGGVGLGNWFNVGVATGKDGGGGSSLDWLNLGATMGSGGEHGGANLSMAGGNAGIGGGGGGGGGYQEVPGGMGGNGGTGGWGGTFGGGGGGGQGGIGHNADGLLYGGAGGSGGNGGNGGWGGGGGGGGNGGTGGAIGSVRGGVTGNGGNGGTGGDGGFGGGGGKGGFAGGPGAGGYYTARGLSGVQGAAGTKGMYGGDGALNYGGGGAGLGGAIFVNNGSELTITNSSFVGNSASGGTSGGGDAKAGEGRGGAIFALGSVTLGSNVTFGSGANANSASTASANVTGPENQTLIGTSGNDVLLGGGGNDTVTGLAGNDSINGSVGIDLAIYSGALHNYTLSKSGTTYTVHANSGTDGTDTLTNVESLKFADMSVNLTIQAKAAAAPQANVQTLTELYVAFFNRVPAADGLSYWIDQMSAGQSINQIAGSFYAAGIQYSSLTGFSAGMSNDDFINTVFRNVLDRPAGASADGLAYWRGKLLDGSATHGSLVTDILASAHSFKGDLTWGWVADLLDNKYTVAKTFAIDWGLGYNTAADNITHGVAIAAAVTPTGTDAAIALVGLTASDMQLG